MLKRAALVYTTTICCAMVLLALGIEDWSPWEQLAGALAGTIPGMILVHALELDQRPEHRSW